MLNPCIQELLNQRERYFKHYFKKDKILTGNTVGEIQL